MARQLLTALERSEAESACAEAVRKADAANETPPSDMFKELPALSARSNLICGPQINSCYAPPPQDAKSQSKPAAKSEPSILVVDAMHRGDFATITDALSAAKPGTKIFVRPGFYKESIVIRNHVELIGDGERNDIIIEASGKYNVLLFYASQGRVVNFTLRQTGDEAHPCVNISQGKLNLESCDISSQTAACVIIHQNAEPLLIRNRIHGGTDGVVVSHNGKGTLEDNDIFANVNRGVVIKESGALTLRGNRIVQNGELGILVWKGGGGIFEDNDLRGNATGAWHIDPSCEGNVQRRGNKE